MRECDAQERQGCGGERGAEDAAENAEKDGLGEMLEEELGPGGSERLADGDFMLPGGGADHKQAGYVGAGDEQDEGDGAHQTQHGGAQAADELFAQWSDGDADGSVGGGIGGGDTGIDSVHVEPGRGDVDTIAEPAQNFDGMPNVGVAGRGVEEREGKPKIAFGGEAGSGG